MGKPRKSLIIPRRIELLIINAIERGALITEFTSRIPATEDKQGSKYTRRLSGNEGKWKVRVD